MTRYHINPETYRANLCRATVRDCPISPAFGEAEAPHFETKEDLRAYIEEQSNVKHGETTKLQKPVETPEEQKIDDSQNITYSFLKEFEKEEEKFKEDFDGVPNRFFNADLAGKEIAIRINAEGELDLQVRRPGVMIRRLTSAVSSPKDAVNVPDEKFEQYTKDLGLSDLKPIRDPSILGAFRTDEAWVATAENGDRVVISGAAANSKLLTTRYFRYGTKEEIGAPSFKFIDKRSVVGAMRIQRKTGRNVLGDHINAENYAEAREKALEAYHELVDAQGEGKNFLNQKKYVRDNTGKVATAWMDKKNPSKEAKAMMQNTSLKQAFRHVEVDNDVDPAEFADFEKAYHEVEDKLPPIPGNKQPELRIRKLGKHGSAGFEVHGLFNPAQNSIAIDVRNSGSFIHEYGHQLDLITNNNASLQDDFKDITKQYSRNLQLPPEASKRHDYYTTPTEIHSRCFEVYAHERLGIDNRLLDKTKFDNFDYAPIQNNPELKQRAFDFFDNIFKK